MSSGAWLAVDGGQSGIRLRLSTGAQATADGVQHRPGGNVPVMLGSLRAALRELGEPRVQVAALGMSGLFQEPGPLRELADGVMAATGADRVLLSGDDVTGHAGALRGRPGVVAAIGTGTTVIGLSPDGRFTSVDGRGYLLGDDGSGFDLGRRGLRAVLEHAEGLAPATALTRAAVARFGPVEHLAHAIYRSAAPVAAVASFARDVISAAGASQDGEAPAPSADTTRCPDREAPAGPGPDPTAAALVRTAMQALARSIRAAAGGFGGTPVPVVVVGGLMRAADVLLPPLTEALDQHLPSAVIQQPLGTALDGAAWLASNDAGVYEPMVHRHRAPATE